MLVVVVASALVVVAMVSIGLLSPKDVKETMVVAQERVGRVALRVATVEETSAPSARPTTPEPTTAAPTTASPTLPAAIGPFPLGGGAMDPYDWAIPPSSSRGATTAATPSEQHPPFKLNTNEALYVLLIHVNGDAERWTAVSRTWFRQTSPDIGLLAFGLRPPNYDDAIPLVRSVYRGQFPDTHLAFLTARAFYPKAKFFFKGDDDGFLYTRALISAVATDAAPHAKSDFMGFPFYNPEKQLRFLSGGAGYSLSRFAVDQFAACSDELDYWEDVAVTKCMTSRNVSLTDMVGTQPHNAWVKLRAVSVGKSYSDFWRTREEPWESFVSPKSYHYVTPPAIHRLHDEAHYWHGNAHGGGRATFSRGIPKNMHWFVAGDTPSAQVRARIESCRAMHPFWTHYVWTETEAPGMVERLVYVDKHISPKGFALMQTFSGASIKGKEIVVLAEALFYLGGVAMSTSVVCRPGASLDVFLLEMHQGEDTNAFDGFVSAEESGSEVSTLAVGLRANSPAAAKLALAALDGADALRDAAPSHLNWARKALADNAATRPAPLVREVSLVARGVVRVE